MMQRVDSRTTGAAAAVAAAAAVESGLARAWALHAASCTSFAKSVGAVTAAESLTGFSPEKECHPPVN